MRLCVQNYKENTGKSCIAYIKMGGKKQKKHSAWPIVETINHAPRLGKGQCPSEKPYWGAKGRLGSLRFQRVSRLAGETTWNL